MCLLMAEAVEDHFRVHTQAGAHQQRPVPGAEGGEGARRTAEALWRDPTCCGRAGRHRPHLQCHWDAHLHEGGCQEAQPVHKLTVVPHPVRGPDADMLVCTGGQPQV